MQQKDYNIYSRITTNLRIWALGIILVFLVLPNVAFRRDTSAKMQWLIVGAAIALIGNMDRPLALRQRIYANDESDVARQANRQSLYAQATAQLRSAKADAENIETEELIPLEDRIFDVREAFAKPDYPHYMLVAPSGSGKTTTIKWLIDIAKELGSHITVLTPHEMGGEFGEHKVISDKEAIYWQIHALHEEMVHRYAQKPWREHMDKYKHLTYAIDEAVSLFADFKQMDKELGGDVQQKWVKLLVEARKVKIRLIVATQSNRVDCLGLKGRGDIMECLTKMLLGKSAKQRLAKLDRQKWWPKEAVAFARQQEYFGIIEDADCHRIMVIPRLS